MNKMKLGDILEIQPKSKRKAGEGIINGKYPFYTCSNELTKSINTADYEGDALIMGTGGMASIHYEKGKFSTSTDCLVYKSNKNVNLSLINKYLRTNIYLLENGFKGAGLRHISRDYISNITIPLPERNLQDKIVTELDLIEKTITNHNDVLKKYDTLIKSRFIEMFGDPVINEKDWDLKTLPELGEFGRGVSKHRPRNAPELLGGKYPLIQTGDVANANLYITDYESTYSEEGFKQSKMWKAGTLCITIAATIAKTAILTFDSCFPDSVVGFTPNEKTNSLFINYWFSFFQKILEEQAPAVAQKNINLQVLSELKIITPPISLQNDFATFVQQIDKSKFEIWRYLKFCDIMKRIGFILYD